MVFDENPLITGVQSHFIALSFVSKRVCEDFSIDEVASTQCEKSFRVSCCEQRWNLEISKQRICVIVRDEHDVVGDALSLQETLSEHFAMYPVRSGLFTQETLATCGP